MVERPSVVPKTAEALELVPVLSGRQRGSKSLGTCARALGRLEYRLAVDEVEYAEATERSLLEEEPDADFLAVPGPGPPKRHCTSHCAQVCRRLCRIAGLLIARAPVFGVTRPSWDHAGQAAFANLTFSISFFSYFNLGGMTVEHGGWPFLVAWFLCQLFLSFPLFVLESTLGQFSGLSAAIAIRRMCPLLEGVGWGSLLICLLLITRYVPLMILTLGMVIPVLSGEFNSCNDSTVHCSEPRGSRACLHLNSSNFYNNGRCLGLHEQEEGLLGAIFCPIDACIAHGNLTRSYHDLPAHWFFFNNSLPADLPCAFGLNLTKSLLNASALRAQPPFLHLPPGKHDPLWHALPLADRKHAIQQATTLRLQLYPSIDIRGMPRESASALASYLVKEKLSLSDFVLEYCRRGVHPEPSKKPTFGSIQACLENTWIQQEQLPQLAFAKKIFIALENQVNDMWTFDHPQFLLLSILVWILVALPACKGPGWLKRTLGFSAFTPILVSTALFTLSAMLPGFVEGVRQHFCQGHPSQLLEPDLWVDAAAASLLSNNVGLGVITTMSSYAKFGQDALLHALVHQAIVFCFGAFLILASCGLLGAVALELNLNSEEIVASRSTDGFSLLLYAGLDSATYKGHLIVLAAFTMFFAATYGTVAAVLEAVVCQLEEASRARSVHRALSRPVIVLLVSTGCFVVGLPFLGRAGFFWMENMEYTQFISIIVSNFFFATLFACFYGAWGRDLNRMFGIGGDPTLGLPTSIGTINIAHLRSQWKPPRVSRWLWSRRLFRWVITAAWYVAPFTLVLIAVLFSRRLAWPQGVTHPVFGLHLVVVSAYILLVLLFAIMALVKFGAAALFPSLRWGPAPVVNARGLFLTTEPVAAANEPKPKSPPPKTPNV